MRALTTFALLAFASVALADTITVPDCVEVEKQTAYRGLGYNHSITVKNHCDVVVTCTASSDSAPDEVTFTVPAGGEVQRTLKIGAPGSRFDLRLVCREL